ncbi:sigma factor G inhibitor Gin [Alicyclobacillus sp. ALC3]|uniref:sigma factor G inhibitor Gin n=1 Tax=Alicyclobacillus sp. ALC3 TaxID=2796143 RepID=UPI002378B379|nr:sigma factor G inhibitor Gin [Alicyclobacillus sp. ALC3]WDL99017.1 sigma factor G inhibitor Gin [Alicyclobacillus sp. ALC3]
MTEQIGARAEPSKVETCIVCGHERTAGIHIVGQFLCTECEHDIVVSDVTDVKYRYYIERMKQIWLAAIS